MSLSMQGGSTTSLGPSSQSVTSTPTPSRHQRRPSALNGFPRPYTNLTASTSRIDLQEAVSEHALLIPTDRLQEDLEAKWIKKLGPFRVFRETELSGYSLYSNRDWYLSRTCFAHTIMTSTGRPTDYVHVYVLVPESHLSGDEAKRVLDKAIQILKDQTGSHPRKIDMGMILLNQPAHFSSTLSSVPSGDMRKARPYMVVNTGLRRLGCGGRAALGMDSPTPALRRKFIELYRLPNPAGTTVPLSRTHSPTTASPPRSAVTPTSPQSDISRDPFTEMVKEIVKLIQASLAIWGLFGSNREDLEVDGLFCNETKEGITRWMQIMGMHEHSEEEKMGGCIDPKTLAALLSSITSVTYELNIIGVHHVPKDPFKNVKRFLNAWATWQGMADDTAELRGQVSHFVDVAGIRALNKVWRVKRGGIRADWTNVPHTVASTVMHATSSLTANLKGGGIEDGPLRKREIHPDLSVGTDDKHLSGVGLVTFDTDFAGSAPPDVIMTDLEMYTRSIMKSRDKDQVLMGAKRIGDLWKGQLFEHEGKRRFGGVFRSGTIREGGTDEDTDDGGKPMGPMAMAGHAFKGLVGRKTSMAETSDSDYGGGFRQHLNPIKRKTAAVPTVIEPPMEETDERPGSISFSTSPSGQQHLAAPGGASVSTNRTSRIRPSINTNLSHESVVSTSPTNVMNRVPQSAPPDGRFTPNTNPSGEVDLSVLNPGQRALAWRNQGKATAMLRTSSDGADVSVEENGLEWEVIQGHGTGKGQHHNKARQTTMGTGCGGGNGRLERRHSLESPETYTHVRRALAKHMAVDVEMCMMVQELRVRERQLAEKARDIKALATSIHAASRTLSTATQERQSLIATHLDPQLTALGARFQQSLMDVDAENDSVRHDTKMVQHAMRTADPEEPLMRSLFGRLREHVRYADDRRARRVGIK